MSSLFAKYNSPKIAKIVRRKSKPLFSPTIKWVEYSLDLIVKTQFVEDDRVFSKSLTPSRKTADDLQTRAYRWSG